MTTMSPACRRISLSSNERLGWELWRGALAGLSGRTLIPTPDQDGIMILRLRGTPDFDLDGMLTIECDPGRIW